MANTLLPGDFVLVNLSAYKINTPREVPFIGLHLKYFSLFNTGKPELNDLVLIQFPPFYSRISAHGSSGLIKRIIALPGDTLQIINKQIYVNGKEIVLPVSSNRNFNDVKSAEKEDERIFFKGSGWNSDNYGPLVVPSAGDTIIINNENIKIWQNLIVLEHEAKVVRTEGSVITIEGKPARNYIVQKDQYFVMGDNFNNSYDSRYFGFINEDMILGRVMFIYWSVDESRSDGSFFSKVRWDRIFNGF